MKTLSHRAAFWVSAAVMAHAIWTSAAPAMTYRLYAAKWSLTTTSTTAIFAVYPVFVVLVLILFGDLSDYIGRRATMLLGLGASLTGVLLFAVAPNVAWVFVGRAFMGLGVGLSASPASAAMVEFSPVGQTKRASVMTTVAQSFGLGAAVFLGGALIQYAPYPLHLNFVVLLLLIAVLLAIAWFLPRTTRNGQAPRWRPKLPKVPRPLHGIFLLSATSVTGAYALGALVLSLGGQIAHDLIGSNNAFANGAALSVFALSSGVCGIAGQRLSVKNAVKAGSAGAGLGMILLPVSAAQHSLIIFLVAAAAAGVGYSLLFMGGLNLMSLNAPPEHRGGSISAVYLVGYVGQGLIALTLGRIATRHGLEFAIDLGAVAIGTTALFAVALTWLVRNPAEAGHRIS